MFLGLCAKGLNLAQVNDKVIKAMIQKNLEGSSGEKGSNQLFPEGFGQIESSQEDVNPQHSRIALKSNAVLLGCSVNSADSVLGGKGEDSTGKGYYS